MWSLVTKQWVESHWRLISWPLLDIGLDPVVISAEERDFCHQRVIFLLYLLNASLTHQLLPCPQDVLICLTSQEEVAFEVTSCSPPWHSYVRWHISCSMAMFKYWGAGGMQKRTILTNVHCKNITRTLCRGEKQTLRIDFSLLLLGNDLTAPNAHIHTAHAYTLYVVFKII